LLVLPAHLSTTFAAHHGRRFVRFQRWRFTSAQSFFAGAGPIAARLVCRLVLALGRRKLPLAPWTKAPAPVASASLPLRIDLMSANHWVYLIVVAALVASIWIE